MDRLVFGMHHLTITQIGTLIDGKSHYSHPNAALDLAGEDPSIDFWRNMESDTYFYCSGSFGTRQTGNTRFFVSCDAKGKQKKVLCADGKERVVTLAMTHSDKDYQLYHIYEPGAELYREGVSGKTTGNHIHLEVAEGSQKTKYYDTKMGVYRMKNELNPVDVFFILEPYTTVVNTQGLTFKVCSETEVKDNMTEGERLVSFARTQIGKDGRDYWNYFGYKDDWCSEFVSYCGNSCGFVPKLMPKVDTCKKALEFYAPKNEIRGKSYLPSPGDIIFFGSEGTDHTGIVEKVDDNDVTVIEGNAGNTSYLKSKVCRTVYKRNNGWIWGYASPFKVERTVCDMIDKVNKLEKAFAKGLNANANGVDYKLPKSSTVLLITAHNSTASLNSMWVLSLHNNKAVKLSGHSATMKVWIKDQETVTVQTELGSPRTYWMVLEEVK